MGRTKQQPETSAKHAKILKVAGKMFMAQSYDAISMDALAEAVPVSKRTLYNHFKDKKALFTAVMQNRCKTVFEALEHTIQQDLSVEQTLTKIGEQFLSIIFNSDAVNIWRVAIAEVQQFPELGKMFYEFGPKRSIGLLADYFRMLHARKEMRIPNPELSSNVFFSMLKSSIQTKRMLGIQKSVTQREMNEIIAYAVELFMAGHKVR